MRKTPYTNDELFNITSENSRASAGGGMNRPDWKIG